MSPIIGLCTAKCPEGEMKWRQRERLIHVLEADEASVTGPAARRRADPERMVKSFQRSAAGVRLNERRALRPPHVLLETTNYLLRSVLPRADVSWPVVYAFCLDRLRAVRQDLTVQQARGADTLAVLRRCAAFHLYADYRSRDCPAEAFDRHINTGQLHECLVGVQRLQLQLQPAGQPERRLQELFLAAHLLSSLPRADHHCVRPHTPELQRALEFRRAWQSGNFVRAARLAAQLPPLLQLAVYPHIAQLRSRAISVLSAAYRSTVLTVPAAAVADWLRYDDVSTLISDVAGCGGLSVTGGHIRFGRKLSAEEVAVPDREWRSLDRALKNPARLLEVCQISDTDDR